MQAAREVGLQGAGRDGGEVGLEQDVVDRLRQQRREDRPRVVPGDQRPPGRGESPSGDAEPLGLLDRPADLLRARARPSRPGPLDPRDERGDTGPGGQHRSRRKARQHLQRHRTRLAGELPRQLRRQRVPGLARPVLRADQPDEAVSAQPRARQRSPLLGERQLLPGVRGARGRPHLAGRVERRPQQPREPRDLDEQGSLGLGHLEQRRQRTQFAHPEPAGPQHPGGGAPHVEQQRHATARLERGPGTGPVHQRRVPGRGRELRRSVQRAVVRRTQPLDHLVHRPPLLGAAPHQRQVDQPLQRGGGDRVRHRGGREQRLLGLRPVHRESFEQRQLRAVQPLHRLQQRSAYGGTRGHLRGVLRRGVGQVGALAQQQREPLVGPAAELVGEGSGSGGRGHQGHATGVFGVEEWSGLLFDLHRWSDGVFVVPASGHEGPTGGRMPPLELHHAGATDVGSCARPTRTRGSPRARSSSSRTAWAATTAATSRARS